MFLNLPHKLWNCVPIPFAASLVQLLDILSRLCFFTLAIVSQHMHGGGELAGRTLIFGTVVLPTGLQSRTIRIAF